MVWGVSGQGGGPPSAPCGVERLLSSEGIGYCSALEGLLSLSLSPQGAGGRRLTQHPGLLSHLRLRSSWAGRWGSPGGGRDACGPHAQHDLEESPPLRASLPHLSRGRWAHPSSERKWRRTGGRRPRWAPSGCCGWSSGPVAPSCHLRVLGAGRVPIRKVERALLAPPGMNVGLVRVFGGWWGDPWGRGPAGWQLLFLER